MSSIRVIAGRFGGRLLDAPKGNNKQTKPMGERIRNAMFNSLGNEVVGARVLDAFAGTGAIGLEALSRGAAHVTFIERDKIAQKILSNNVSSLGAQCETKTINASVNSWIESSGAGTYDIIFADPPYLLSNDGFTCQNGQMVSVNKGSWDKSKGLAADLEFYEEWLRLCYALLKPNGTIWVCGTYHNIYLTGYLMQVIGYHILNNITWEKPNPPPNLSCRFFTHSTETLLWAKKK